jgi:putative NADH-flavin reductase
MPAIAEASSATGRTSPRPLRAALFGATGNAGSRILKELLDPGHQVTAIVRRAERAPMHVQ